MHILIFFCLEPVLPWLFTTTGKDEKNQISNKITDFPTTEEDLFGTKTLLLGFKEIKYFVLPGAAVNLIHNNSR